MKRLVIGVTLALGLAASGAWAAEDAACKNVRFADVGWTDIQVTTGATQVLLEALGYAPEVKTLSVPVTYASLKNKDIDVFLGWTPHPVMGEMKIHYLDGMGDSGFGAATVHTNVRAGYLTACPNVGKLLSNLKFNLAMEGAMMAPVLKDGADPKATALAWLKANPDAPTPWLAGVTTIDGKDAAAAVKAALAK